MLQRLYIHNFRCLQNFEIKPEKQTSLLLIGKNGVGKSTIAKVLSLFQKLGTGTSRVASLVTQDDFTLGRTNEIIQLELETSLDSKICKYSLALDKPEAFRELRVVEEDFSVDDVPVYTRKKAEVSYPYQGTSFSLDWHNAALPLILEKQDGPLQVFRNWLRRMHILSPIPQLMGGESHGSSGPLSLSCDNFADYLLELLTSHPASYVSIHNFLKELMPDLREFSNKQITDDTRVLQVRFGNEDSSFTTNFQQLSDGEKCMFLGAVMLPSQRSYGDFFVFWDEPDNYLALSEVEHFIRFLRKNFNNGSQIWMTSHHEGTINCFSHENTLLLRRKTHTSPVELRPINELLDSTESVTQKLYRNELD